MMKLFSRKVLVVLGVCFSLGLACNADTVRQTLESQNATRTICVEADKPGVTVSLMLYGIFFEELSNAGDGGLYAEMVRNRDFESIQLPVGARIEDKCLVTQWFRFNTNDELYPRNERRDLPWWSVISEGQGNITIALDDREPLHINNPHSMRIEIKAIGSRTGVANQGYWGMAVRDGEWYDLAFYARTTDRYQGRMTATLESADGAKVYAQNVVKTIGGGWQQYKCALQNQPALGGL